MGPQFGYEEAFGRNLGWLTEGEQQRLRDRTVGVAGLGGVGGSHVLALARLGIGGLRLADPDAFELANFNRQAGANLDTLGRGKLDVLSDMARRIDPELRLGGFPEGLTEANLDAFLDGTDLVLDGLDFFLLDIRARLFDRCAERGIPVVTAAPLGMGTALLTFLPDGPRFEDYFRLAGLSPERRQVNFLAGLAPRGLHRPYLMDPSRVDFASGAGPSTVMGCELCAGVAATEALKLLLGRGPVRAVPRYQHFDAYRGRWVRGWLPGGNGNPLQALRCRIGYRVFHRFGELARSARPEQGPSPHTDLEAIVERARWAPSGDNAQPWRFELLEPDTLQIRAHEAGDVYDFAGRPSRLSLGFLLESVRLAASERGRGCGWSWHDEGDGGHRLEVNLAREEAREAEPLGRFLAARSVDRGRYRMARLGGARKAALAGCLDEGLTLHWLEEPGARWRVARLNAAATDIRLRIPEAFEVHRRILDWERSFSPEGVPAGAVGVDPLTLRLMRWAMGDWRRLDRLNRWAPGTLIPRLELDLVPGLLCSAHFLVTRERIPESREEDTLQLIRAGAGLQRLWLTAERMGLVMQPTLAPLCFAHYGREGTAFTGSLRGRRQAEALAGAMDGLRAGTGDDPVFLARIGWPIRRGLRPRSLRRSWSALVNPGSGEAEGGG